VAAHAVDLPVARRRRRPRARPTAGALALAALAVLVALALGAPHGAPGPQRGDFAAAAAEPAVALPGVPARPAGSAELALRVASSRLTAVTLHDRLPCADGRAMADHVSVALPRGPRVAGGAAFRVEADGVRVAGRFLGADRAAGTVTRTVGPCALADARWTARRAG
jgi:hypothetical protein